MLFLLLKCVSFILFEYSLNKTADYTPLCTCGAVVLYVRRQLDASEYH
jgi:hypothetical protein